MLNRMEKRSWRKVEILGIADSMAAAASSRSGHSYDQLVEARSTLVALCDKWEKEDESSIRAIERIKSEFDTI